MAKGKSLFNYIKKDPYNRFIQVIPNFNGAFPILSPQLLPENGFTYISGFLTPNRGVIPFPKPTLIITVPQNIVKIAAVPFSPRKEDYLFRNNSGASFLFRQSVSPYSTYLFQTSSYFVSTGTYKLVLDVVGTLHIFDANNVYVTSFYVGRNFDWTLSTDGDLYIISSDAFYCLRPDRTLINLGASLDTRGDCIVFWKGRLFIGTGKTVIFSVPNPDPTNPSGMFSTTGGGGFIKVGISSFTRITGFSQRSDNLYIFTDGSIISLVGTTISNDPSTWYLVLVSNDASNRSVDSKTDIGYETFFAGDRGIWSIVSVAPSRFDQEFSNIGVKVKNISRFIYRGMDCIAILTWDNELYLKPLYFDSGIVSVPYQGVSSVAFAGQETYFAIGAQIYSINGYSTYSNFSTLKIISKTFTDPPDRYKQVRRITVFGHNLPSSLNVVLKGDVTITLQKQAYSPAGDYFIFYPPSNLAYKTSNYQIELNVGETNSEYEITGVRIEGYAGRIY